jgi:hypothetical protein
VLFSSLLTCVLGFLALIRVLVDSWFSESKENKKKIAFTECNGPDTLNK